MYLFFSFFFSLELYFSLIYLFIYPFKNKNKKLFNLKFWFDTIGNPLDSLGAPQAHNWFATTNRPNTMAEERVQLSHILLYFSFFFFSVVLTKVTQQIKNQCLCDIPYCDSSKTIKLEMNLKKIMSIFLF